MNDINLSSQAWCDLIFEGRNKSYGAYSIRLNSSSRHLKSLLIVTGLGVATLLTGNIINRSNKIHSSSGADSNSGKVTMTEYVDHSKNVEPVAIPKPEVPIVASIAFNPPVIAPDPEVNDDNQMLTQKQMTESDAVIAGKTFAGNTSGPGSVITDVEPPVIETPVEKIHIHVEQMPAYPGGESELMVFLKNNLNYPVIAAEQGIQGMVVLRFVVGKDGSVGEIEIVRSLDPSCDKEAIRVIKKMPKWIPGKQNGMEVKVYHTLPVRFKLST